MKNNTKTRDKYDNSTQAKLTHPCNNPIYPPPKTHREY